MKTDSWQHNKLFDLNNQMGRMLLRYDAWMTSGNHFMTTWSGRGVKRETELTRNTELFICLLDSSADFLLSGRMDALIGISSWCQMRSFSPHLPWKVRFEATVHLDINMIVLMFRSDVLAKKTYLLMIDRRTVDYPSYLLIFLPNSLALMDDMEVSHVSSNPICLSTTTHRWFSDVVHA